MISITCSNCKNTIWVDENLNSFFCTCCGKQMTMPVSLKANPTIGMAEHLLEKGLLELEAGLRENARLSFLEGLSFEPDDLSLLFAMTMTCNSTFAKKYFSLAPTVTKQELDILDRFSVSHPHDIEVAFEIYSQYDDTDRKSMLIKRYPEIFTQEKLLFRAQPWLKDRAYVEWLVSVGVPIKAIFDELMHNCRAISYRTRLGVTFCEEKLPLDVLEMYLQLGVPVDYEIKVWESYFSLRDSDNFIGEVEVKLDLYTFFERFNGMSLLSVYQGRRRYLAYYHGQGTINGSEGNAPYFFESKGADNEAYLYLLRRYGYQPSVSAKPPKKKRILPKF